jgi:hypothetical protein
MVVVLVVIARTPTATMAAAVGVKDKGRAANMKVIIKDAGLALTYRALTTASPICAVPTLVVLSL